MWWLLVPGVIILLGFLPLGFFAYIDQNGANLSVKIGPLHFPVGKKTSKPEPEKPKKTALGADYTLIIGDSEIDCGKAQLRNMQTGEQTEIELDSFKL